MLIALSSSSAAAQGTHTIRFPHLGVSIEAGTDWTLEVSGNPGWETETLVNTTLGVRIKVEKTTAWKSCAEWKAGADKLYVQGGAPWVAHGMGPPWLPQMTEFQGGALRMLCADLDGLLLKVDVESSAAGVPLDTALLGRITGALLAKRPPAGRVTFPRLGITVDVPSGWGLTTITKNDDQLEALVHADTGVTITPSVPGTDESCSGYRAFTTAVAGEGAWVKHSFGDAWFPLMLDLGIAWHLCAEVTDGVLVIDIGYRDPPELDRALLGRLLDAMRSKVGAPTMVSGSVAVPTLQASVTPPGTGLSWKLGRSGDKDVLAVVSPDHPPLAITFGTADDCTRLLNGLTSRGDGRVVQSPAWLPTGWGTYASANTLGRQERTMACAPRTRVPLTAMVTTYGALEGANADLVRALLEQVLTVAVEPPEPTPYVPAGRIESMHVTVGGAGMQLDSDVAGIDDGRGGALTMSVVSRIGYGAAVADVWHGYAAGFTTNVKVGGGWAFGRGVTGIALVGVGFDGVGLLADDPERFHIPFGFFAFAEARAHVALGKSVTLWGSVGTYPRQDANERRYAAGLWLGKFMAELRVIAFGDDARMMHASVGAVFDLNLKAKR
jgi:hypothetical protein